MRILLVALLVLVLALAGYGTRRHQYRNPPAPSESSAEPRESAAEPKESAPEPMAAQPASFNCDGRTYCSQMTSCAEATFFLKNCPGTKMDGDNDGIPCESQWCRSGF